MIIPVIDLVSCYLIPSRNFCSLEIPEYFCRRHRFYPLGKELHYLNRQFLVEIFRMMPVVHRKEKSTAIQTKAYLEIALTVESHCTLPVTVFLNTCPLFSLILRAIIAIN